MNDKNSHNRNMIMSVTRMYMKISATSPLMLEESGYVHSLSIN